MISDGIGNSIFVSSSHTEGGDHPKHDTEESADDWLRYDDEDGSELTHDTLHHHQASRPLYHAPGTYLDII